MFIQMLLSDFSFVPANQSISADICQFPLVYQLLTVAFVSDMIFQSAMWPYPVQAVIAPLDLSLIHI